MVLVGLYNASGKLVYFTRYDISNLFHPRGAARTSCPLDSAGWLTSGESLVVSYAVLLAAPQEFYLDAIMICCTCFRLVMPNEDYVAISN